MSQRGGSILDFGGKKMCSCCFELVKGGFCSFCGYNKKAYKPKGSELPVGMTLNGRYNIGMVLGQGGFGVTYKAFDKKEGCIVAVKEYYPRGTVYRNTANNSVSLSAPNLADDFRNGQEKFYKEAETISRFNGNPNIVGIKDFFYDKGTAYYAMEYLDGMDLKQYIKRSGGKLPQENVLRIANTIANALLIAHSMDILHRDISPDNIYVLKSGGVKLIDFGAAREVMANHSHSLSVILKQGFAPVEQYQRKGKQGPWTDIYALGATMYYALTGRVPDDATERLEDPEIGSADEYGVDNDFWAVVRKSMEIKRDDRYQNITEMKEALKELKITEMPLTYLEDNTGSPVSEFHLNSNVEGKSVEDENYGDETVVIDEEYRKSAASLNEVLSTENSSSISRDIGNIGIAGNEENKKEKRFWGRRTAVIAAASLTAIFFVTGFLMFSMKGNKGRGETVDEVNLSDNGNIEDRKIKEDEPDKELLMKESPQLNNRWVPESSPPVMEVDSREEILTETPTGIPMDLPEETPTETPTDSSEETPKTEKIDFPSPTSEKYNITDGFVSDVIDGKPYIKSAYFCLYFDEEDYSNKLWDWKSGADNAISLYYAKADGGTDDAKNIVITIKAYDGDLSYKEVKKDCDKIRNLTGYTYQMAGEGKSKKYVVFFINKYSSDNKEKQKEYDSLLTYAKKIDKGKKDNPFICSDN